MAAGDAPCAVIPRRATHTRRRRSGEVRAGVEGGEERRPEEAGRRWSGAGWASVGRSRRETEAADEGDGARREDEQEGRLDGAEAVCAVPTVSVAGAVATGAVGAMVAASEPTAKTLYALPSSSVSEPGSSGQTVSSALAQTLRS